MSERRCSVDGCARRHYGKGFCQLHYNRLRNTGTTDPPPPRVRRTCCVEGCESGVAAEGMCHSHLARMRRHGDPLGGRLVGPAIMRFLAKVDKNGPLVIPMLGRCWLWTAARTKDYGIFDSKSAYRFSHNHYIGPVPDGYEVDHLCAIPSCVNPLHLEAVPPRVNWARSQSPWSVHSRVTHCPKGHAYDEANTHITKRGERKCRRCNAERMRASSRRARAS